MVDQLLEAQAEWGLEGVTFLGGEPFLQAQGLAVVAEGVSRAGLSVMAFTGYTMKELEELSLPGARELLAWTDVLVDGPYESANPDLRRNCVGSANERFHYLTKRYDASIEGADTPNREVEWRVRDDGRFVVNGWPCSIKQH